MQIKRLNPSQLKRAVAFADQIFNPKDGSMGTNFPVLFSNENANNILIIEDEEKKRIVSMVGMYHAYAQIFSAKVKVVFIGAICTDKNYRGRGYATRMIYEAERIALKNGSTLMMIHGDNDIYRSFGAVEAGTYFTVRVDPEENHSSKRTFRKAKDEDVKMMALWHSREQVRFIRPFADFKTFYNVGHAWDSHAETFVNDSAYITVIKRESINHCIDFAGNPTSVSSLIQGFTNKYGLTVVHLNHANKDCMSALLMKAPKRRKFYGTMKTLDKDKLLEQLKGYFEEALSETDKESLIRELQRFNNSDFTKIVFGSTEKKPNFYHKLLPIPLPDYHGMDYI